jgi:hypothetical protein
VCATVRAGACFRTRAAPTSARSASVTRNCRPASKAARSTITWWKRNTSSLSKAKPRLRLGEERYKIKAGDYVGFPAGQRAGHCLVNEGDKPFRFIMIGDNQPNEVCVYPDSNKISVSALRDNDRFIMRNGERLDYWDGEKKDEPLK